MDMILGATAGHDPQKRWVRTGLSLAMRRKMLAFGNGTGQKSYRECYQDLWKEMALPWNPASLVQLGFLSSACEKAEASSYLHSSHSTNKVSLRFISSRKVLRNIKGIGICSLKTRPADPSLAKGKTAGLNLPNCWWLISKAILKMLLIPQSPHYKHGRGWSVGLFPSNLGSRGSFEQGFINIPIDEHEGADEEKPFAVSHPLCQVFSRLEQLAWPRSWAAGCFPRLHAGCATGPLHVRLAVAACAAAAIVQRALDLLLQSRLLACWEWVCNAGLQGKRARVARQAGLELLWNMWRPPGHNAFKWVFSSDVLKFYPRWEGEAVQKQQTNPRRACSLRRNFISPTSVPGDWMNIAGSIAAKGGRRTGREMAGQVLSLQAGQKPGVWHGRETLHEAVPGVTLLLQAIPMWTATSQSGPRPDSGFASRRPGDLAP